MPQDASHTFWRCAMTCAAPLSLLLHFAAYYNLFYIIIKLQILGFMSLIFINRPPHSPPPPQVVNLFSLYCLHTGLDVNRENLLLGIVIQQKRPAASTSTSSSSSLHHHSERGTSYHHHGHQTHSRPHPVRTVGATLSHGNPTPGQCPDDKKPLNPLGDQSHDDRRPKCQKPRLQSLDQPSTHHRRDKPVPADIIDQATLVLQRHTSVSQRRPTVHGPRDSGPVVASCAGASMSETLLLHTSSPWLAPASDGQVRIRAYG